MSVGADLPVLVPFSEEGLSVSESLEADLSPAPELDGLVRRLLRRPSAPSAALQVHARLR